MEMMDCRNSARGHLIALENKSAIYYYLDKIIKGTIMNQKAYKTMASSNMHTEAVDQLVALPSRAVLPRHFEVKNKLLRKYML